MEPDNIDDLLKADAFDTAERLTGKSYKESESTAWLGMALHLSNCQKKEEALKATGDSHYNITVGEFIDVIEKNGFEHAYQEHFAGADATDALFVYARRDGLLLTFETYSWGEQGGNRKINSGKVFYNWQPFDVNDGQNCMSSGSWLDGVIIGDHDCREGLIHNMTKLAKNGKFLNPWKQRHSCLWIMSYMDWKTCDSFSHPNPGAKTPDQLTEERIAKFPTWVRAMMGYANE